MPQEDIEKYAYMDDPVNCVEVDMKVDGNNFEAMYYIGGEKIYEEKYKLGEKRVTTFDGVDYEVSNCTY